MNVTDSDRFYHINCCKGDIGRFVIVPGDPGRCEKIASFFDNPVHIGQNREYNIYSGTLLGEKVSVCSTGIGGPSTAIAIEELIMAGADTFIRIGTCGGINLKVKAGDNCIALSAIRMGGTADEYAPKEYPATASYEVVQALEAAAVHLKAPYHVGVVQCKDSFYGQHNPESMPVADELKSKWEAWKRLGVLASEMESDTLFTVAATRGVRAGSIFHVIWNQERFNAGLDSDKVKDNTNSILIGIEALKLLIEKDKKVK